MERVQPPQSGIESAEEAQVTGSRDPARLAGLIAEAQGKTIERDRIAQAAQINALLIAMRAPGNEAAEAKAVLAALDLEALHGLTDARGRRCTTEAVETLIACGFPHALEVRPEDLEHRQRFRKAMGLRFWLRAGVGVTLAALGVLVVRGDLWAAIPAALLVGRLALPAVMAAAKWLQHDEKPTP
jgi:hypothetical protein